MIAAYFVGYAAWHVLWVGVGTVPKHERRGRHADWSLVPDPKPPVRTVVWTPDMVMQKEPRLSTEPEPEPKPRKPRRTVKFEDGPAQPVMHMFLNQKTGEVLESYQDLTKLPGWEII